MKINRFQHILLLMLVYLILLIIGLLAIKNLHLDISEARYASLLTSMTIITGIVYFIVRLGFHRESKERGMFLLAGLGGKLLAYLILILIFWMPSKNLSKEFIIAFFVLYLLLTIFLISTLLKELKTN